MALFLTVCVAFLGAYLGLRYKLPAGAMVGSMVAVIGFHILFGMACMPQGLKFYTQIATGAYVGARISRSDARGLRKVLWPAAILTAVLMVLAVGVGSLICRISALSVSTALFSMAPAGIADMTLASMDFPDAQPSIVALIQTLRVMCTVLIMPFIIRRLSGKKDGGQAEAPDAPKNADAGEKGLPQLAVTLAVALVCGGLGRALGVPGGTIAFSMAGCALYNIRSGRGYMPLKLRRLVQVFAGALIGSTVGREQVRQLADLWGVALLAVVSFLAMGLLAAVIISRCTDMDLTTALFACAPGGLTDMALIAADMGADSTRVAGMQMFRMVSIIALYPSAISWLVG